MSKIVEGNLDAKGMKVALVVSRFNEIITSRLLQGAEDCLERHGCSAQAISVYKVPGSWEIPVVAKLLAEKSKFDAIVGLGALIRGETPHFETLAREVSQGLAEVQMKYGLPVIFGVLTTDTVDQATERAGSKLGNKGWVAALAAIEMVNLLRRIK